LWDERTGLLASALAALSPFQIYYSQEARMYMLMTLLGAVCVYATLRMSNVAPCARAFRAAQDKHPTSHPVPALSAPHRANVQRWSIVYLLAAIAGMYTHYLFPIVLVVCSVVFAFKWLASGRTRSRLIAWLLVQAIVLLAFVPWLPIAVRQLTTWPLGAQTFTAIEAPLVVLRTLSEGLSAPRDDALWLALFGAFILIGALPLLRVQLSSSVIALLYLLVPIAGMFAFALFKDAFLKFLLVASPPFVLLVAHGITNVENYASRLTRHAIRNTQSTSRVIPLAMLCALAIPAWQALGSYYFDSRFARDDYRSITQIISALARDGDATVLDAPGQQEIFSYYYHGSMPIYPLPRQRPVNVESTTQELEAILAKHPRIFALFWATDESDPPRAVESWLNAHAFKASDVWFGNVRLATYANAKLTSVGSVGVSWRGGIRLAGYATAFQAVTAGDVWPLTLVWRNEQPIGKRYKVFVHLLDPRGFVLAQRDAEPVGGSRPTTTWQLGETILDSYGLSVPFGTPPREYTVEVGLYDLETGERLLNERGEDHLLLSNVRVWSPERTPPLAVYDMQRVEASAQNGVLLLGYRLEKQGAEGQRDVSWHAGDTIHLVLFWRKSESAGDGAYRLSLGPLVRDTQPCDGLYPVGRWHAGEVVRDDQLMLLPSDWRAGRYAVAV
ncbi:MAG: hypothetical protein LC737_00925, partial [Chloroflexi bacterium]|nr:hypothetical protein [Chloroflexota bacterium]